jgi:hypothetical protein
LYFVLPRSETCLQFTNKNNSNELYFVQPCSEFFRISQQKQPRKDRPAGDEGDGLERYSAREREREREREGKPKSYAISICKPKTDSRLATRSVDSIRLNVFITNPKFSEDSTSVSEGLSKEIGGVVPNVDLSKNASKQMDYYSRLKSWKVKFWENHLIPGA